MLANLAMRGFDAKATEIARSHGMTYTRYADDLTLSIDGAFSKAECSKVIGKVVLGLLVDGDHPRLSREFRALMRLHLYCLKKPDMGPCSTPGPEALCR
jgi:RNA-directed DNA polymerase